MKARSRPRSSSAVSLSWKSMSSLRARAGPVVGWVAVVGGSVVDLGGQVVLHAHLRDQLELGLEPVGVRLLADELALEQRPGAVVALGHAQRDAAVVALDGGALEVEVEAELLGDRLAHPHRVQA